MPEIVTVKTKMPVVDAALIDEARRLDDLAVSTNTRRAYDAAWKRWVRFAEPRGHQLSPAEPASVALFVAHAGRLYGLATIEQTLSVLSARNRADGYPSPLSHPSVARVWRGLRRDHAGSRSCKSPLLAEDVKAMVAAVSPGPAQARDRALVLFAFASAMRRSEIAEIDLADLEFDRRGLSVKIKRSKTDQSGEGQSVYLLPGHPPHCPLDALDAWLSDRGEAPGRLFLSIDRHGNHGRGLSDRSIADILKKHAAAIGIDPRRIGGHSARSGFVTQALLNGSDARDVQLQTRHKSFTMLQRYARAADLKRSRVSGNLGL